MAAISCAGDPVLLQGREGDCQPAGAFNFGAIEPSMCSANRRKPLHKLVHKPKDSSLLSRVEDRMSKPREQAS